MMADIIVLSTGYEFSFPFMRGCMGEDPFHEVQQDEDQPTPQSRTQTNDESDWRSYMRISENGRDTTSTLCPPPCRPVTVRSHSRVDPLYRLTFHVDDPSLAFVGLFANTFVFPCLEVLIRSIHA